jgi:hypothetical protein
MCRRGESRDLSRRVTLKGAVLSETLTIRRRSFKASAIMPSSTTRTRSSISFLVLTNFVEQFQSYNEVVAPHFRPRAGHGTERGTTVNPPKKCSDVPGYLAEETRAMRIASQIGYFSGSGQMANALKERSPTLQCLLTREMRFEHCARLLAHLRSRRTIFGQLEN